MVRFQIVPHCSHCKAPKTERKTPFVVVFAPMSGARTRKQASQRTAAAAAQGIVADSD